jgi:two-component system NtrC family response regulator
VSINCGAIPENLLESELFGHEKGSFTGAHASRMGRLEMADGGIVFLDEVAEMTVPLQVKLLRFLQDHEIERVGGRQPIELNVRVVAATNKNLEERVAQGLFREDLYYRLSVVNIQLPPLRERAEDIVFLAQHFLECSAKEYGGGGVSFSSDARRALRAYAWPGNVRELENKVRRAVLMSNGRSLGPKDLGLNGDRESQPATLRETRMDADRQAVDAALRATGGNISEAAKVLDISRPSLHELLTKLEVNAKDYKPRKK